MKLKPVEILKYLGFDIPEDGVEINENDAYLVTSALRFAGESIDFDRIEDSQLAELHRGLAATVAGWVKSGQIAPMAVSESAPSSDSVLKLRATLNVLLAVSFKRQVARQYNGTGDRNGK